jgi:uncharacterized protein (DUF2225 family)
VLVLDHVVRKHFLQLLLNKKGGKIMSRQMPFEGECPTHKVQLEYKGMEDVHTGGKELEIMELIGTFFWGIPVILLRDLLVRRTTFDFYVCPICHYTVFIEDSSNNANNATEYNGYREYKKKLKNVSQLLSEIKNLNSY